MKQPAVELWRGRAGGRYWSARAQAQQQTSRTSLLLSIDGTARQTHARTDGHRTQMLTAGLGQRQPYWSTRYDTRCYFNVRSKADTSQLNLPHGKRRGRQSFCVAATTVYPNSCVLIMTLIVAVSSFANRRQFSFRGPDRQRPLKTFC